MDASFHAPSLCSCGKIINYIHEVVKVKRSNKQLFIRLPACQRLFVSEVNKMLTTWVNALFEIRMCDL